MKRNSRILIVAALAWRSLGQSQNVAREPNALHSAVAVMVSQFNAIGGHAAKLRQAMTQKDAEAFDAVMRDVMSALMALPGISAKSPHNPETILPEKARPDRITQLGPDLVGLERFFERLSRTTGTAEDRKMFRDAQHNTRKMLAALPSSVPTVSSKTLPVQR